MDRKQSVDDILSEIKRKKAEEKGTVENIRPPRPVREDIAAESAKSLVERLNLNLKPDDKGPAPAPEQRDAREEAPDPVMEYPPREKDTAAPDGGVFKLDKKALDKKLEQETAAEQPASSRKADLTDFEGHVRPLTERAKISARDKYINLGKPQQSEAETAEPADPARGREVSTPASPARKNPLDVTREHTRMLPNLSKNANTMGTGRELKLEDIRKMDFSAISDTPYTEGYYEDEDELTDGIPEGGVTDRGEYNSPEDRRDVSRDIAQNKLWLFIRVTLTGILTFALFWMVLHGRWGHLPIPPELWPESETMGNYILALTVLTALVGVVGSATVGGGIANLFRMRANSDSLAALAVLAVLGQGVAGILNPGLIDPYALNLYFPLAALAMLFNAIAKLSMIGRIQQNFRIISVRTKRNALMSVESDQMCYELIREPSRRRPVIAFGVRAGFFTDFLALSYSDKYDVGVNRSVAPACFLSSLAVGFSTYFLTQSMYGAISAFAAIMCVCATLSAAFVETVPLSKLAKRLTPQGAMVSGNKAVEDFCDTRAIILGDKDLFPRGHVSLLDIPKAFSRGRIDEAILDAASVACALNGALAPLFLDMIGGNKALLRKVDNIVYETGMGVSAWVDQRRVLIGNRLLMQNHGITLPHDRYEQGKNPAARGEPIYLSNSGEVSARFLVGYAIDSELAAKLDALGSRGRKLIVYTCDANLTPHKIWELYGYPENQIDILPSEFHSVYRDISENRDTAAAQVVYNGKASAMIESILACINARASILSATVIQMMQIILGYGLVAFMAFMNMIGDLNILQMTAYQIFWFAVIYFIQQVKQA
jgi:cation transport ATPase